jgi:C4-dicarboxylate transporter DctQ subunit
MKKIVAAVHAASAVLLIVAVLINCANIAGRYLFSMPIASAEEVMLFLLVAVVFVGNSAVAYEGRQIRMDVLLHALPPAGRYWLEIFSDVAALALSAVLIVLAWPVMTMLVEFDQRSQAADIPLVIPQAAIPVGLALTVVFLCIRVAGSLASRGSNGRRPEVGTASGSD